MQQCVTPHSGTWSRVVDVVWLSWCPRDVCSGSRHWVCGRLYMRGLLVLVHFCRTLLKIMCLDLGTWAVDFKARCGGWPWSSSLACKSCFNPTLCVNTRLDISAQGSVAFEQGISYWAWKLLFTHSMCSHEHSPMQPVLVAGTTSSSRSQTDPVGTHHSGTPGDPLQRNVVCTVGL